MQGSATTSIVTPALIRELSPRLLAFAARSMREPADAEDVVQETWISALASAHRYEARSSAATWLTTILRRRIADKFSRQRWSEPLHEDHLPIMDTPEDSLRRRELSELTHTALSQLSEQERRAIELCDLEQCERDQACSIMGVTRTHLRVLLFRARQKLASSKPLQRTCSD